MGGSCCWLYALSAGLTTDAVRPHPCRAPVANPLWGISCAGSGRRVLWKGAGRWPTRSQSWRAPLAPLAKAVGKASSWPWPQTRRQGFVMASDPIRSAPGMRMDHSGQCIRVEAGAAGARLAADLLGQFGAEAASPRINEGHARHGRNHRGAARLVTGCRQAGPGGRFPSGAGILPPPAIDRRLGSCRRLAGCIEAPRRLSASGARWRR